jgi:ssDNA-binding Zn-finger/Zn-ribbon topoisomerase 1
MRYYKNGDFHKRLLVEDQELEISCPTCGAAAQLIVKTNRHNGSQFAGCPNFPACNYTQPIPEAIVMEMSGQARLF